LIAAGLDLLSERPIDAIAIDAFVTKAGVAKGSFFNHFADKQELANAVAGQIRVELEARVTYANETLEDPIARIAGGMRVVAEFSLARTRLAAVLLRSQSSSTARTHPLNKGIKADIDAACAMGLLRPEAMTSGVLYWLGLCQILMIHLVEKKPTRKEAAQLLAEMQTLGLTGLGVSLAKARRIAENCRLDRQDSA
jgi:AcrR family transcriptional regulator